MHPEGTRAATPLTSLKGVGPALATKLEKLGLSSVEDLLFLLPLRYEDRTQLVKIGSLVAGTRCLVTGEVLLSEVAFRGRRNLLVRIGDGSGQLTLRFFHFSRQQQAQFEAGKHVTCFGEGPAEFFILANIQSSTLAGTNQRERGHLAPHTPVLGRTRGGSVDDRGLGLCLRGDTNLPGCGRSVTRPMRTEPTNLSKSRHIDYRSYPTQGPARRPVVLGAEARSGLWGRV